MQRIPLFLVSLLVAGLATEATAAAGTVAKQTEAPTTKAPVTKAAATSNTTSAAGNSSSDSGALDQVKDHLANAGANAKHAAAILDNLTDINATGANLSSVWGLVLGIMDKELHNRGEGQQMITAGASFVLGAVMLWDGLHVFEIYVLLITFFVVFILMMGNFQTPEYAKHFGSGTQFWQKILSLQVAILISFTFKFSMGLVKKFIGLGLGIFVFLYVQTELVSLAEAYEWDVLNTIATSPTFLVLWAFACFPAGVWLFSDGPSYVFAIISPFFGAIMVSSALFYTITTVFESTAEQPAWIDFVYFCLCTGNVSDIGPLAGKQFGISYNRWALCTFAFGLFVGFGRMQFLAAQKDKKKDETLCDKVMGCLQQNCGACKGSRYYEPLLAEKDRKILELEAQLEAAKKADREY